MLVRVREGEPEAVIGIARYDVHMKVRHILKRNLAVGDEKVHASRPKRVAHEGAQQFDVQRVRLPVRQPEGEDAVAEILDERVIR